MENKVFLFSSTHEDLVKVFTSKGGIVTTDKESAFDVAVFTPGEDISPFLYGAKKIKKTNSNFVRDMRENQFYRRLPPGVPKIGVGRGAQLLCALEGGRLWQHVSGHAAPHSVMKLTYGDVMMVTSRHHQQMIPPSDCDILVVSNTSDRKEDAGGIMNYDVVGNFKNKHYHDIEAAFSEKHSSLMIQFRPDVDPNSIPGQNSFKLFHELYDEWIKPLLPNKSYTMVS